MSRHSSQKWGRCKKYLHQCTPANSAQPHMLSTLLSSLDMSIIMPLPCLRVFVRVLLLWPQACRKV